MIMRAVKYFLFFLTAVILPAWVELIWGDFEEANNTASEVLEKDLT